MVWVRFRWLTSAYFCGSCGADWLSEWVDPYMVLKWSRGDDRQTEHVMVICYLSVCEWEAIWIKSTIYCKCSHLKGIFGEGWFFIWIEGLKVCSLLLQKNSFCTTSSIVVCVMSCDGSALCYIKMRWPLTRAALTFVKLCDHCLKKKINEKNDLLSSCLMRDQTKNISWKKYLHAGEATRFVTKHCLSLWKAAICCQQH